MTTNEEKQAVLTAMQDFGNPDKFSADLQKLADAVRLDLMVNHKPLNLPDHPTPGEQMLLNHREHAEQQFLLAAAQAMQKNDSATADAALTALTRFEGMATRDREYEGKAKELVHEAMSNLTNTAAFSASVSRLANLVNAHQERLHDPVEVPTAPTPGQQKLIDHRLETEHLLITGAARDMNSDWGKFTEELRLLAAFEGAANVADSKHPAPPSTPTPKHRSDPDMADDPLSRASDKKLSRADDHFQR